MKISLQWLGEWADTGTDVRGLAHALTMVRLEVEAIQPALRRSRMSWSAK